MEIVNWDALLDDEEDSTFLDREESVDDLLRETPEGCLYCRLSELGEGDDD